MCMTLLPKHELRKSLTIHGSSTHRTCTAGARESDTPVCSHAAGLSIRYPSRSLRYSTKPASGSAHVTRCQLADGRLAMVCMVTARACR